MISPNNQNIIDALSLAGFNCNLSPIGNTSTLTGTISRGNLTLNLTISDLDLSLSRTTFSYDIGPDEIELLNIDNPSPPNDTISRNDIILNLISTCDKISNIFDIMDYELAAEQEYLAQEALDDARWLQERLGNEVQIVK